MKDGVIQQFDTPQMLYNHPKNVFVAGFIGSPQMNLINSIIKKDNECYFADFSYFRIKLPRRMNDYLKMYENKDVIIGIRPEDLLIAEKGDKENTFDIYIDIAEMTGSDFYLYGSLNDKKIIAKVPSNQNIESDKKYNFKINVDRIHIFDKINERLICD
jgi:multiple sugar transport system ATP-binding protein